MTSKTRILVVEDDAQFRRYLAEVLDNEGYEVLLAENGVAAQALMAETAVDVVLTDLVMPDQDGISLIRSLRKQRPAMPVLAMSGRGRTDLSMDSLALVKLLGADATLEKPFTLISLRLALSAVLTRH